MTNGVTAVHWLDDCMFMCTKERGTHACRWCLLATPRTCHIQCTCSLWKHASCAGFTCICRVCMCTSLTEAHLLLVCRVYHGKAHRDTYVSKPNVPIVGYIHMAHATFGSSFAGQVHQLWMYCTDNITYWCCKDLCSRACGTASACCIPKPECWSRLLKGLCG